MFSTKLSLMMSPWSLMLYLKTGLHYIEAYILLVNKNAKQSHQWKKLWQQSSEMHKVSCLWTFPQQAGQTIWLVTVAHWTNPGKLFIKQNMKYVRWCDHAQWQCNTIHISADWKMVTAPWEVLQHSVESHLGNLRLSSLWASAPTTLILAAVCE